MHTYINSYYINSYYINTYIHTYVHTDMHTYICMHACMHVCVCVCVCNARTHARTRTHTHTHTHTTHTHTHTYTSYKVPNDRLLFFMEAFLNLFDANGIRADPQDVGGEVYILQSQYSNCIVTFIIVKNMDGFIHYGADV